MSMIKRGNIALHILAAGEERKIQEAIKRDRQNTKMIMRMRVGRYF